MKIAFANDHAGVPLRARALDILRKAGHDVVDFGVEAPESVDYPDYAEKACRAVAEGGAERAVLLCGTGQGMAMAANRIPGIRAARCVSVRDAQLARAHNNANVIALPGTEDALSDDAERIIQTWLTTTFEGGRHQRRLDKMAELEERQG